LTPRATWLLAPTTDIDTHEPEEIIRAMHQAGMRQENRFVFQHRLKDEYACQVVLEPRSFQMARWLEGGWPEANKFWGELVEDADANPAILFENDWQRRTTAEKNPELTFLAHPAR